MFNERIIERFNGLRSIGHLYILFLHYFAEFLNLNENSKNIGVPLLHINRFILMYIFVIFFVINGINCGRWMSNKIETKSNFFRMVIKFYFERLSLILPITYLYFFTFMVFIYSFYRSSFLLKMNMDSLLSNLLFIGNFISLESNVSID